MDEEREAEQRARRQNGSGSRRGNADKINGTVRGVMGWYKRQQAAAQEAENESYVRGTIVWGAAMKARALELKPRCTPEEQLEFEYLHVREALARIDRARQNLIKAQNGLARLVHNFDNPYSTRRFEEFYAQGGVTADEWKAYHDDHKDRYVRDNPDIRVRQLRVVRQS